MEVRERDHDTALSEFSFLRTRRRAKKYHDSLLEFVRASWDIIEPERAFVCNWHIEELCEILQDITEGKTKRVIINVPPGTMKSLLVSVLWPVWAWARNPKLRVLTATYSDRRALDANLKARKIIQSAWFQEHFPDVVLVDDQNTKGRFDTTQSGWRIATSVGGEGTGLHPDIIIIDDASTAADAQSDTLRKAVNDWMGNTISSRGVSRGVAIVVIGQRLHEEDLSGYLLKSPAAASWLHVCWPMRYEKCMCPGKPADLLPEQRCVYHKADPDWNPDPRDHRTKNGELLWPELYNEASVKQLELDLGPDAAGQLQQRPSAEGGRQFKREDFKYTDKAPALMRASRGWDTAATEDDGDWTVGVKIGEEFEASIANGKRTIASTGRFYVCDVVRDQLGPDGVDKLMKSTAQLDGKNVAQREEKEGGASGKSVIEARAKLLKGYNYAGVQISGSKVVRAKPFRAQVQAGNVYLVRGPWNEAYLQELCNFPAWKNDDQVDGSSTAFNSVLLEEPPTKVKCTWGD